jgi:hypothetical protein
VTKKIVYTLTILVALWGFVYAPLQCIETVRQYTQTTSEAFRVVDFLPLMTPMVFVVMLIVMFCLKQKLGTSFKEAIVGLTLFMSIFSVVMHLNQRSHYLF